MSISTGARYQLLPGLLLGFHGTDRQTANKVLGGRGHLKPSTNEFDWLGHGIYFWEYGPQRAYQFAQEKKKRGEIKSIAVIGAVIDPGVCFNLLEASALAELKAAYDLFDILDGGNENFPKNEGGEDLYKRYLDCAVVEMVHRLREVAGRSPLQKLAKNAPLPSYDTVRGAFWEGKPLYPDAGFKQKNHVQICVRNTDCIKGYFRVLPA